MPFQRGSSPREAMLMPWCSCVYSQGAAVSVVSCIRDEAALSDGTSVTPCCVARFILYNMPLLWVLSNTPSKIEDDGIRCFRDSQTDTERNIHTYIYTNKDLSNYSQITHILLTIRTHNFHENHTTYFRM